MRLYFIKILSVASLLLVTTSFFFSYAFAATIPPQIISYQGRLTDNGGTLLGGAGTTYYFKFSLWDNATVGAGNKVWPTASPTSVSKTVKQGVFSVNIGDTANGYPDPLTFNFTNNTSLYIQIEVSSDNVTFETLGPRQQLTSTIFAQVAGAVVGTTTPSTFGTTTAATNAFVTIAATSSSSIPLSIAGTQGQTANLFQILNNSFQNLFSVGSGGAVTIAGLSTLSGGVLSAASSTIGSGTQTTGLTIFGGATTTANAYFGGTVAIGTTTPATGFSLLVHGNSYHSGTSFFGGAITATSTLAVSSLSTLSGGFLTAASSTVNGTFVSVGGATFNSTLTAFGQSTFANASSTAISANTAAFGGLGTTSIASNGTLTAPNITIGTLGGILKAAAGVISAAVAGTDYANFSWPFTPALNGGVATSTLVQFNGQASSTQFSATQAYFGGTATSTFTSTGFLGIGTSTPQWNLQVAGTRPSLALSDTNAGANLKHWLFSSQGGNLYIGTSTDLFGTSSPAALSISSLGTSTFSNGLDIRQGCLSIGGTCISTSGGVSLSAANTWSLLQIFTSGLFSQASSTIGSGTQIGGLTVWGGATTTGNLLVQGNATTSAFAITGIISSLLKTNANGSLIPAVLGTDYVNYSYPFPLSATSSLIQFNGQASSTQFSATNAYFGGTATSTFTTSGFLGIGTSTPNWNLQVAGTRPSIALTDFSAGTNLKHWLLSSMGGNFYLGTSTDAYGTSSPATLTILNSGNIGIGTSSPMADLAIQGADTTSQIFDVSTLSGISALHITAAGKIGLGTTTANWNLQVAGTRPSFALSDTSAGANLKHWLFSSMGGSLYIGTSTDLFGTSSPAAISIDSNGTTTFSNGISILKGCFLINGACFAGGSGASLSVANTWTALQQFNSQASSTQFSATNAYFGGTATSTFTTTGFLGIGTSTPNWNLQIAGTRPSFALSDSSAGVNLKHWLLSSMGGSLYIGTSTDLFGTSSPAAISIDSNGTTTFSNGVSILKGCFLINGSCFTGGAGASLSVANTWSALQQFQANASTTQLSVYNKAYFGATATSTFTSTGFLGVGTSTPQWNLQVAGTRPSFALSDASANTNLKHWLFSSMGGNLYVGTSTDAFATSSTPFTLMNNGRVGVGTSTPYAMLSVQPSTTSIIPFAIGSSTSNLFSIDSVGNVNLSPFTGTSMLSPTTGVFTFGSLGTTVIQSGGNISLGSNTTVSGTLTTNGANDDVLFHAGNNLNIVLRQMADDIGVLSVLLGDSTAGGALSIGTTSPNKNWALDVAGTRPILAITDNGAGTNLKHWLFSSQGGNLYIGTSTDLYATSTPAALTMLNSGRMGLGTSSPASLLSVAGSTYFGSGSASTMTIHSGFVNYPGQSTTTIPTTLSSGAGVWNIATSSSAGDSSVFSINSNAGTTTISLFGATSTALSATGLSLNPSYKNALIIGNGKTLSSVTIAKGSLCVSGAGWCTASSTAGFGGSITARNYFTTATVDVAEMFPSDIALDKGDIVAISSTTATSTITRATSAMAASLVGIISTDPGLTLGQGDDSPGKYPVALAGRVPVHVTLDNGPIYVGDRIAISSTTPGFGMKAGPFDASVGVALEPFTATSTGNSILVFIDIQKAFDLHSVGIWEHAAQMFDALSVALGELTDQIFSSTVQLTKYVVGEVVAKTAVISKLFAEHIFTKGLDVGTEAEPAGVTLYDTATHAPYCLSVTNGSPVASAGKCGSPVVQNNPPPPDTGTGTATSSDPGTTDTATSTDSTPPVQ